MTTETALRLLQRRAWFEAHEVLEQQWMHAEGAERRILQALIHATVSLVHLERGNARGAWSQWQKARLKLGQDDPAAVGLDVGDWWREVGAFYAEMKLADAARRGQPVRGLPDRSAWPAPSG